MRDLLHIPAPPAPLAPIRVAFSGGLDSTVLLYRLATDPSLRRRGIHAVHVNHGMHSDSARWALHCARTCASLEVALSVVAVRIVDDGTGPEAAAREARYRGFVQALQPGEILALAQHRDDQAETVLLRLLRASGSAGLGAMPAARMLAEHPVWRPLLRVSRADLLAYARAHRLTWIEDPSNLDARFDRNWLRRELLPLLRKRWPQADAALARSAELLRAEAELLAIETDRRLRALRTDAADELSVSALLACEPAWRARILRAFVQSLRLPPLPGGALEIIERDLLRARADANPQYRWRQARLSRWRDRLHAGPIREPLPANLDLALPANGEVLLPDGARLSWQGPPLVGARVRARRGGERIRLPGRQHSHSLAHALQQADVPIWERAHLPLLIAADGELLAAGDRVLSDRLAAVLAATGGQLRWIQT